MNKHILAASLLIASFSANAQIVLEKTLTSNTYIQVVNFAISGKKLVTYDTLAKQIKLFNTDYSLWKSIPIPSIPNYTHETYSLDYRVPFISETLFNSDNLIEFILLYHSQIVGNQNNYFLLNEKGDVLQDFGPQISNSYSFDVMKFSKNEYKLVVREWPSTVNRIYSLPGSLPCDDVCDNSNVGLKEINNNSTGGIVEAIPNPSSNTVTITYSLPSNVRASSLDIFNSNGQKVKSVSLDRHSKQIVIDNREFPSGMYFYSIVADGMQSTVRKMIVVK